MTVIKMNPRSAESELLSVDLDTIVVPPHRMIDKYPLREKRITAAMAQIANIGVLEGIIARRAGNKFESANGFEVIEAARRSHLKNIPLIVRSFTDEEGLKIQASEHQEDNNADFLDSLCVWEAAVEFRHGEENYQIVEIARFLGWDTESGGKANNAAYACDAAYMLIAEGHMTREAFRDLSIKTAREIAQRTRTALKHVEKDEEQLAKTVGRKPRESHIKKQKEQISKAAKQTAEAVRSDDIKTKDIGAELNFKAYENLAKKAKETPSFARFSKTVIADIHKMLVSDGVSEKLEAMAKAVAANSIEGGENLMVLRGVDFALAKHADVTAEWRTKLKLRGETIEPHWKLARRKEYQQFLIEE